MNSIQFIKDLSIFLVERKKWWLAPILIFLFLFGTLIVLSEGSSVAPFLYALF
jgi:hypothetical protein